VTRAFSICNLKSTIFNLRFGVSRAEAGVAALSVEGSSSTPTLRRGGDACDDHLRDAYAAVDREKPRRPRLINGTSSSPR
jgi:hypothetical protein